MESISGQDESYVKPRSHEANLRDYNHVLRYNNKRIIT